MMNDITNNTEHITKRHRRHTIARPASALALISDSSASEDDSEDDHQFDRISDILSNLIQEANEAVSYEKVITTTNTSIPLVRKLSSSSANIESVQKKRLHKTSRPISYPSSSSLISVRRRSSATIVVPRPSITNISTKSMVKRQKSGDEIIESFKRLDSSMAMIDSLSRDLVPEKIPSTKMFSKKSMMSTPFDSRLSALLLLPLLHVPHALISLVFDTITSQDSMGNHHSNNTLGDMVVWAFIFAITNLVVDKAVNTPKNPISTKILPGTFEQTKPNYKKRPKVYKKRNSRQQQLYFQQQQQQQQQQQLQTVHLPERKSILSRRNSL